MPLRTRACAALCLALGACAGDDPSPTPVGGAWTTLAADLPSALLCVTGNSTQDVWSVGSDVGDGPLVVHYDGAAWSRIDTGTAGDLWWLWLEGDAAVWMAGAGGRVLRHDRATGETLQVVLDRQITFFGIWGAAGDDVWAVGGNPNVSQHGAAVWHLRDGTWAPVPLPEDAAAQVAMFKVWGAGADDVWVVGNNGTALHWTGDAFVQVPSGQASTLFTVAGDGEGRVFAVGGYGRAAIVSWDGASFTDESPSAAPQLNGVSVRAGRAPVAAGAQGAVWWREGGTWSADPRGAATVWDLHGAWLDETGAPWVVGGHVVSYPLDRGTLVYGGEEAIPTLTLADAGG